MRGSLTSLLRLSVFVGLGLCLVAIGLGRMVPPSPDLRSLGTNRVVAIPIAGLVIAHGPPRFLDFDGGRSVDLPIPSTDRLIHASCSPWKDERGESHVVGAWSSISGEADSASSVMDDSGIARFSFPSGRVIERISTEIVPGSPPCWFPNAEPRILFAAGDGNLYRLSFAGSDSLVVEPNSGDDLRVPRQIAWREESRESVCMTDPAWPEIPAFGNRVIVSATRRDRPGVSLVGQKPKTVALWSLLLSPDGGWIESASRLTPADSVERDERFAGLGRAGDGTLRLAYLTRRVGETAWTGRIATVALDSAGGNPSVLAETIRDVVENCVPVSPSFSSDGLHVDFARRDNHDSLLVKRIPLMTK